VAQDLLQLYSSVKLCSPTISLSAFVNALSDAAWHSNLQQVRKSALICPQGVFAHGWQHAACINSLAVRTAVHTMPDRQSP